MVMKFDVNFITVLLHVLLVQMVTGGPNSAHYLLVQGMKL